MKCAINKNTLFYINNQKVVATNDFNIFENTHGIFILNFWEPCVCENIDIKPVYFVEYNNKQELYVLEKDNIVIGDEKGICLI